jgi:PAS domain S-box-containing protein
VGRTDYELFPKEIADRYVKNDRAVLEAGRPMAVEEYAYHDDGLRTYISVKFPVKTRDGRVVAVGGIGTDITDRKQLEDASRRLSAIVESSGDAIYIYDFDGKILTWNHAAQELYGFEAGEIIGRSVDAIVPAERIQELQDTLKAAVQGGSTLRNVETLRMKRDGSVFPAVLTVSPIRDESGSPVALAVIARDISDQKRREESLRETQKLESLGLLAGGIAHDFNNLLTGVIGNASLLEGEFPGDAPQAEIVQALIEAAERMSRLTSQMLAYSGRGHFVVEPVDLSKEVLRITSLIQASMPKNVELRLSLSNSLPLVNADISQLQQIIMNLVINAAEAVGGANGTVELRTGVEEVGERELRCNVTRNAPPAGKYVALTVQDTGCGMDEPTQARIFDPFFTTKFTGRGLGLSSVLGIVRGHNGLITVESQPGAGSNFRVFLPISGAAMAAEAPEAKEARGSGTVLVVDDEDVVRSMARASLQRLGYRVVTANNGQEAAELFAKNPAGIDLVLLDMTMPVLAGEETLKRLLEIRRDARVLAMSGLDEREAKQRFGDCIAGFIQKPFTAGQLGTKVAAVRQAKRD